MKSKLLGAWLAGTVAATPAYAQDATSNADQGADAPQQAQPQAIIVTASKRSERLSDVPLAVTALGGDDLRQAGVVDTGDLARVVPSFNVQNSYYGNPVYYIRGVGFSDPTPTVAPAVSVYLDQVPLPYSIMARGAVLDLERVEVLKGPQGTLFGQNSTGGAVNYIPARPGDVMEVGADISYGRFNTVDASAYVGGPITDTLGVRVAGQIQSGDDWQFSTTRDDTRGQKKFLNGRIILAWEPSDTVNFELTAQAWHDGSDTPAPQYFFLAPQDPAGEQDALDAYAAESPAPDNPRAANWDPNSPTKRDTNFYQIALRGGIDLSDSVRLNSITSYSNLDFFQPFDLDGTAWTNLFSEETVRRQRQWHRFEVVI